jgi:site-specific DNA-methyltransferase (adenine-specific)
VKLKLKLGDCLEVLKTMPDNYVDLILTDPPYGTTACNWDIVIPFEPMWEQIWRVLKPNGACLLFGSEPFSSTLRISQIKYFKYDWIWHKSKPSGISTVKYMPMKNHEIISCFSKNTCSFFPIMEEREASSIKRLSQGTFKTWNTANSNLTGLNKTEKKQVPELRYPTTVKFFPSKSNNKENFHPTQKPVPLLEYLIKTYTNKGETVLDFTMGSGSTGVACVNTDRNFVGIEKDEKYFETAKQRIEEAQNVKK